VPAFYTNALVILAHPAFTALGVVVASFAAMVNASLIGAAILSRVTFHPIAYAFYATKFYTCITNSSRI